MDKRYQVFISSTYADLTEERQNVYQTLMEMDCIPSGMELFPAVDEGQWEFIKKVIDDCDYYLLIIGGRYGSVTTEGISFTEKEFDYAEKRGIRIIGLLHSDPASIPLNKPEIDPVLRKKLDEFRAKVQTNRLIKHWKTADELPGLVSLSLMKTIKTYPAVGWVRASTLASQEVLSELNILRKENEELRLSLAKLKMENEPSVSNLADFDSVTTVSGGVTLSGAQNRDRGWQVQLTWRDLFALIAPSLLDSPDDDVVMRRMAIALSAKANVHGHSYFVDNQEFMTIRVQFKALGLINVTPTKTVRRSIEPIWSLTAKGERVMLNDRTVKKG